VRKKATIYKYLDRVNRDSYFDKGFFTSIGVIKDSYGYPDPLWILVEDRSRKLRRRCFTASRHALRASATDGICASIWCRPQRRDAVDLVSPRIVWRFAQKGREFFSRFQLTTQANEDISADEMRIGEIDVG
jgi:hypothetical protein